MQSDGVRIEATEASLDRRHVFTEKLERRPVDFDQAPLPTALTWLSWAVEVSMLTRNGKLCTHRIVLRRGPLSSQSAAVEYTLLMLDEPSDDLLPALLPRHPNLGLHCYWDDDH